ncbi:MAG: biopolymer transporter ExbB [Methylobacter sp.]|nr:MAG: biopolymer transporter ExbB [Methylobacter sp.]PPD23188.1 MAG: biopolymer transporter ExbB [Methylobacter sp.]PPD36235.1 MAG: biopolymer transporter ExbB [Methylomonas sp.]
MSFTESIQNFWLHSDSVGQALFSLLLAMSATSWFFIAAKSGQAFLQRRRSAGFLKIFWGAPSLAEVTAYLQQTLPSEPFANLAAQAVNAVNHHALHGPERLNEAGAAGEFLTRTLRRALDEETARLEWGLTTLASIASTAPFIGLFGTVWGVYHALQAIGTGGLASLDQIAGPVGEALIMTGLGLAVAIPAVLAYNDCARSNRVLLDKLDGFAHDLFAFLTTGAAVPGNKGAH